mmetsp:Transcript_38093/g.88089  ORF Transcript_38093/g.88089 Transcript_38093/m.88089 type:complete len:217 (+) Transcript_38093:1999-2649(+)
MGVGCGNSEGDSRVHPRAPADAHETQVRGPNPGPGAWHFPAPAPRQAAVGSHSNPGKDPWPLWPETGEKDSDGGHKAAAQLAALPGAAPGETDGLRAHGGAPLEAPRGAALEAPGSCHGGDSKELAAACRCPGGHGGAEREGRCRQAQHHHARSALPRCQRPPPLHPSLVAAPASPDTSRSQGAEGPAPACHCAASSLRQAEQRGAWPSRTECGWH